MPTLNPGGQHRREVRTIIAQWLTAQHIRGLDHVYRSRPPQWLFELYRTGTVDYSCLAAVIVGIDSEDFTAFEGPPGPGAAGGNIIHYQVQVVLRHRSFIPGEQDWSDDEDDYDRIVDAVKDSLRRGRDLGRPDVILTAGVHPRVRAITHQPDPPEAVEGAVDRWGFIGFQVGQYVA